MNIDKLLWQEAKEILLSEIARFGKEADKKYKRSKLPQLEISSKTFYQKQAAICVANAHALGQFVSETDKMLAEQERGE